MGQEANLQNEMKKKEKSIHHLKVEFEQKCREEYNKHIAEIEEYEKKETKMEKIIGKKEKLLKGKKN